MILEKILNEVKDSNGAFVEVATRSAIGFALGFEISGDKANRRFWYYNVSASRPANNAQTNEASKTPQTETVNITASPRLTDKKVRVFMEKTNDNATAFNSFFTTVYESNISA